MPSVLSTSSSNVSCSWASIVRAGKCRTTATESPNSWAAASHRLSDILASPPPSMKSVAMTRCPPSIVGQPGPHPHMQAVTVRVGEVPGMVVTHRAELCKGRQNKIRHR